MTTKEQAKESANRYKARARQQRRIRKWVSARFLADYYEVTTKTVWSWARPEIGRLPPPKKIGPNCSRWDFEEITEAENAA